MTREYRVLIDALRKADAGETWTVDSWRTEADAAQLTSAERGAAHEHAVCDGYLVPLGTRLDGRFHTLTIPTTHPAGKGRRVIIYARTGHPLPEQKMHLPARERTECAGQGDLLEVIGT
ncbi:hypothetical protein H9L10_03650 [Phycicoccus endophyticus]|uniref:Uncharacterized protein n=1 Tax=Phycicoccus endophyticus TaxID=1690220 RepID=A0A7G9R3I9_9MICO|nr:hypothetical protein [Phycicoccus endophyticus]NHI19920.1 hypothetical protein [Phycicoccus endophyticus]QNN50164.1 hypothetical protein H9L10_03650 [Phycicoccus endophyticus]GGL27523.1 hypothetical protein GCM10012283_07130 [Phycicoccus endophyticus]